VGPKGFWSWPEHAQKVQSRPPSGTHRDRTAAEGRHDAHPPPQGPRCRRPGARRRLRV
jgi:hypothetical protein